MSYTIGQSVSGIVSGVIDYGAFVELDGGGTGMIHISKLSRGFVKDIHSVIKKGDRITATVISQAGEKIALSLIGEPKNREQEPKSSCTISDFELMLSSFKTASDERQASINRAKKRKR